MTNSTREPSEIERPATWDSWSQDERDIWWDIEDHVHAAYEARELLLAALPDHSHEIWSLVDCLQIQANDRWTFDVALVAARLKRYRPDLADLIDFAAGDSRMFPSGSPHEFPTD
jgi:hypothetical protein